MPLLLLLLLLLLGLVSLLALDGVYCSVQVFITDLGKIGRCPWLGCPLWWWGQFLVDSVAVLVDLVVVASD